MKIIGIIMLALLAITGIGIMTFEYSSSVEFDAETTARIKASSQLREGRFRGPEVSFSIDKLYWMLKERFFAEDRDLRVAPGQLPGVTADLGYFNSGDTEQLSATWLGHSSLMINIDGYRVMTDPVFARKLTLLGPERYSGELPLEINDIEKVDVVIISHDHYDHLNKESVLFLNDITSKFVVPLGVRARMVKWGVTYDKIVELDWWEEYLYDGTLSITATPGQHFSGRTLTDRNKTLWASWVVRASKHNFFFSGDSGYFDGFKDIGEKFGPFDMTFLECGAYNENWRAVHMFPEEVVQAHLDLKGRVLHPVHWATFNLSLHAWNDPMRRLVAAAEEAEVTVSTPAPGQTTLYGQEYHNVAWWNDIDGVAGRLVMAGD